ncbi:tetratricopeptide repeat protein [uncultured Algoriphagus sp.]|uniref:tetratricopeptide repeat protein n=1 Tax=uncultured Algoriphagus sp. TaxID=417365 RepID=UPI002594C20E|nr:tetratricopeptide repeat protein [uncultured Algoriphagus sp.]
MLEVVLILLISFTYNSDFSDNISIEQNFASTSLDELKVLQKEDSNEYDTAFFVLEDSFKNNESWLQLVELYKQHTEYLFRENRYDSLTNLLHSTRALLSDSDKNEILENYLSLARAFYLKGNYDSLVYWEVKAGDLIDSKSPLYGRYLLVSSYRSIFDGSYVATIDKTLEALQIFEENNDLSNMGLALNSLAVEYDRLGDYQKQREYLFRSIGVHNQTGDIQNLILNYNNLGSSYEKEGQLEDALKYYDLAFEELKKFNSPRLLAQNLSNRAGIFESLGQYKEAERLFLACKAICEDNQIDYGIMLSDLNLGNLYRLKGQFSKANNHLNDALSLAGEMKLAKETALVYERLAWLNRDRGAFKQAYEFLDRYYTLNDSLVNESVRNTANELMEKFESEKKEKEIITLSRNKLNQQFIIALMGLALVSLLFLVQWWRNKQKITKLELIEAEKLHQVKAEALKQREKDLLEETMEKVVLKEQIKDLVDKVSEDGNYAKIGNQLRRIESKQNPWNDMIEKFKLLNPQFVEKLLQNYPFLNQNDLEFCSLIKMNLSTKDIAQILRITEQSVRTRKYRLHKKIGLSKETDLNSWILSLNEQKYF